MYIAQTPPVTRSISPLVASNSAPGTDSLVEDMESRSSKRRRRRERMENSNTTPGAQLPPNHPMHPNNRRHVASFIGAQTGVASLVEDSEARRRRRPGNPWPIPPSQRPGANLPPNHPMHPDNRR